MVMVPFERIGAVECRCLKKKRMAESWGKEIFWGERVPYPGGVVDRFDSLGDNDDFLRSF